MSPPPVLDPIRRTDPPRVPEPPVPRACALARASVGLVLRLGSGVRPGAPTPFERPGAELHRAGSLPVQSDEVEALRRLPRGQRPRGFERDLALRDRCLLTKCGRREDGGDESCDGEKPHGEATGPWHELPSPAREKALH